jgi:flagellar M-ring protein FliF
VRLREEQVRGVVHLVASSVPGLAPERVTIVDGDGQALTDDGDDESQAGADADERRVQLERARERAIQQLLDATLGPGAAVARVTAEMDISQEERVEETYDPERTATRSFELVEERDNEATGAAEGTPGAAANLPGGAPTDSNAATTPLSRRSERRNYEITKSVRRAVSSGGRLGRLTVAVVVDGRWTGTGSSRRFQPRPQDELDRIRSIVASAAGISEARGDQLSVECVAFAGSAEARPAEPTARVGFEAYKSYLPYAAGGLVLLVALIAFLLWRRSRRKAREAQLAAAVQELAAPRSVEGLPPGDDVETEEEIDLSDPLAGYDSLRALSLEVARRDPELAASVVRAWLAEDARQEAKAA